MQQTIGFICPNRSEWNMDKKKLYKYIICITNFIVKTKRAKKSRTKYAEWPNISGWRRCSQYFSLFMNADHLNKPYIYTCSLYVVQKTCSILYYVLCSDIAVYVVAYVSVAFIPVAAVYCPTLSLSLSYPLTCVVCVFLYSFFFSLPHDRVHFAEKFILATNWDFG